MMAGCVRVGLAVLFGCLDSSLFSAPPRPHPRAEQATGLVGAEAIGPDSDQASGAVVLLCFHLSLTHDYTICSRLQGVKGERAEEGRFYNCALFPIRPPGRVGGLGHVPAAAVMFHVKHSGILPISRKAKIPS